MGRSDLILSRGDQSERVRRVLNAALRCVLARRGRISVTKSEAGLLARGYTPAGILAAFRKQRDVERAGLTPETGLAVAIWVVASDGVRDRASGLSHDDRKELDAQLAAAFSEICEMGRRLSAVKTRADLKDGAILELGRQIEALGPPFRRFIRRSDRLWSKQVLTLRTFIDDPHARDAAIADLAVVYQKAFEAATLLGNSLR